MIPIAQPKLQDASIEEVMKTLRSGKLAQGEKVTQFEKDFAEYTGYKFGIATNNGTSALHTILKSVGVGFRDEVIVPDFTFFATASAVKMCGAKPVFADIDPTTFNVTATDIKEVITDKTKAVIGVNLFGHMCSADKIGEFLHKEGIIFIEDSAQSHGATCKSGKQHGDYTHASCYSFYPTKNMTTGEGGMITTDREIPTQSIARGFINHGQYIEKYVHNFIGYNYRMTDISASIGLHELKHLENYNKRRREIAKMYTENIDVYGVTTPSELRGYKHVYHQYVLRIEKNCSLSRDEFASYLNSKGIGTAIHYPIPLHLQPIWASDYHQKICPDTREVCEQVLSIPVHPQLLDREIDYIIETINSVK